jgi:hypothetical protein
VRLLHTDQTKNEDNGGCKTEGTANKLPFDHDWEVFNKLVYFGRRNLLYGKRTGEDFAA